MRGNREVAQRFGENLRRARRRAGISQEVLGIRSGLHRTEIGLLERSARIPRVDTLIKISQGLRIKPAELIEGIEWTPAEDYSPGEFTFQDFQDLEDNPEQ